MLKLLFISFALCAGGVYAQDKPSENFKFIGLEFYICVAPFQYELLVFISDSTCLHQMTYEAKDTISETVQFRIVDNNKIVFEELKIKDGSLYGALAIHFLDPEQLEKDFFGREFAGGCFKAIQPQGEKHYYLSSCPRPD